MNIEDYASQLKQLCVACKRNEKCKDKEKLCAFKKLAFNIAKYKYTRDLKKGLINENS